MRWSWWLRRAQSSGLLWLVVACSSSPSPSPSPRPSTALGTAQQGKPCEESENCASGICVRVGADSGVCSNACSSDSDCPAAENWGCRDTSDGAWRVCSCRALGDREVCGDGLDNDCDTKVDDCRTCEGESVPLNDPQNCGSCGHACQPGETCTDGECSCPQGASFCADVGCVALDSDVNHCGECGVGCTQGRSCTDGACACPAVEAPDFCDGTGCVSLQTDPENCGACGAVCAAGELCRDGQCACATGKTSCDGACVDLDHDEASCGECGQACGASETCIDGSCGCDAEGYEVCGGECAQLATDPAHCGDCDTQCKQGELCLAGSCTCPSQLFCDDVCVEEADPANCGECGHACAAAQRCAQGSCACAGLGLTACDDACVDLQADESNCGDCGEACQAGEQCYDGQCQCPLGQTYCESAGKCVSLLSDTENCGACGTSCEATELCSLGTCRCQAKGALYCASANSCVDTRQNEQHCGACEHSCKPTESCNGGQCGCESYGQVYCASTGACTDTLSNAKHCGACDAPCDKGEVCSNGECRCPPYQDYCSNAKSCVDLTTDAKNCGACGNACGSSQHCTWSECECDDASLTVCGGICHDLQTDPQHCGECGTVCGAALTCKAGACRCEDPTPGNEVRLNDDTLDNWQPEAAFDGTNVGVVYLTNDPSKGYAHNARFARIKPDGTLLGSLALTSFTGDVRGVVEPPHVVWSGTEYGVSWVQDINPGGLPQMMFRRIKANGTAAAPAVVVVQSSFAEPYFRAQMGGLAWSAKYGGYGAYYTKEGNSMYSVFRRLGVDATQLEPEITFDEMSRSVPTVRMAAAPDGTWGILAGTFQLIEADGQRTKPDVGLVGYDSFSNFYSSPLIHDGKTFVTVGHERIGTTSDSGVYLNRGTTRNDPALLFTEPDYLTQAYREAMLAKVGESIALGYGLAVPNQGLHFWLQRYAIPDTLTSDVVPLHEPVEIVGVSTISSSGGDMTLVGSTPGRLLAIWADTRSGRKQLYARAVDLHACP